jgi:poly(glycerol-phosphate) alpha-glucosyltransferase
MHVTFLTPSVSRAAGGIFEIERSLAHALHRTTPVEVAVVGLEDAHTAADLPQWQPLAPTVLPTTGPAAFGYAPGLDAALDATAPDLVHLHALWMYPSVAALRWARRSGRPHVVTINGMLDGWAVQNSAWKKRLAAWGYERANLQAAACLQVNTEKEYRAVRAYGLDTPLCIIPNGVELPDEARAATLAPPWAEAVGDDPDARVLLFLGRLHPKKGLPELLTAWTRLGDDVGPWHLALIGWDDGGHEAALRQQVRDAGLTDRVHLLGPRFGDEKAAAFHHADAFVLPSYSEGLPMAVLEAWSYRLPVLMTPGCNLEVGFEAGAARRIEPEAASIADGLRAFFALAPEAQAAVGQRGRALVEARFTWTQVAADLHAVYRWVLGRGRQPACVRLA